MGLLVQCLLVGFFSPYCFLYVRSVQKVSSHVIRKMEAFIEEATRNIVHVTVTPQSPSGQAPWDLTQFSQLPSAAPSYFPESHQQSEIASLSKVVLILGKVRSCRTLNLDCRRLSHLLGVSPKKSSRDVMPECGHIVMKVPITSCPHQLRPSESSE